MAREGLLVARNGQYTDADVEAATAGLKLVEVGLPIPEVLELARRHDRAMREIAEEAVALFDTHVRRPLRQSDLAPDEAAERLVAAFQTLLPATTTIVTHHFQRMLLAVALEHMERGGDGPELAAVRDEQIRRERGA